MADPVLDIMAKAIGESYDGYTDIIETPNNWRRGERAAEEAIAALIRAGYVIVPRRDVKWLGGGHG